ncbi:hypothetical protein HN51_001213 [Arachis hypogaea]
MLHYLQEGGGEPPMGSLGWAIDEHFGSFEKLVQKVNAEGAALQGSGWVWLSLDKEFKKLVVETTVNQDPLVTKGPRLVPFLGIDVWEHAYYLQVKFRAWLLTSDGMIVVMTLLKACFSFQCDGYDL